MVYFQVQDKKTQVQDEKSELQFGPLNSYLIPLNRSKDLFFLVFKGHYKLTIDKVFRDF